MEPLAESIISSPLKRVIVRTTIKCMNMHGLTQGQNLCGGDGSVHVCVCERLGWMGGVWSQKRERTKSAKLENLKRSRKGEATIKSRIVCVNSQNNLIRIDAYWLQGG